MENSAQLSSKLAKRLSMGASIITLICSITAVGEEKGGERG